MRQGNSLRLSHLAVVMDMQWWAMGGAKDNEEEGEIALITYSGMCYNCNHKVGIEHLNVRRRRNKETTVEAAEATVEIITIITTRRPSYTASATRKGMATANAG
jgi:hypothetical protein